MTRPILVRTVLTATAAAVAAGLWSGYMWLKETRAAARERWRINCMETICADDVVPARDTQTQVVFKRNGQWYRSPKVYGHPGFGGFGFYWPSRAPFHDLQAIEKAPEVIRDSIGRVTNGYDHKIEIFLTGRVRWPDPDVERPWETHSWQGHWQAIEQRGFVRRSRVIKPGLEEIRFEKPLGERHPYVYYVATKQRHIRSDEPAVLSCRLKDSGDPLRTCTAGEYWQPDVYADFRFAAQHANDWPEIHREIVRVLNLLRKVDQ